MVEGPNAPMLLFHSLSVILVSLTLLVQLVSANLGLSFLVSHYHSRSERTFLITPFPINSRLCGVWKSQVVSCFWDGAMTSRSKYCKSPTSCILYLNLNWISIKPHNLVCLYYKLSFHHITNNELNGHWVLFMQHIEISYSLSLIYCWITAGGKWRDA